MGTLHRIIGALGVFAAVAVLICYLTSIKKDHSDESSNNDKPPHPTIVKRLVDGIEATNIAKTMRFINTNGAPNYFRTADAIERLWNDAGLSDVHLITYNVVLPAYNVSDPNSLIIIQSDNKSEIARYVENHDRNHKVSAINFLPYSAVANVEGDVMYCNRAATADFETLRAAGISVNGHISLARYELGDSLAEKVFNAQIAGASAVLIFSDVARNTNDSSQAVAQPPPIYTAKRFYDDLSLQDFESTLLYNEEGKEILPSIPALFISRAVAERILEYLVGPEVPDAWRGVIYSKYHIGLSSNENKIKIRIQVTSKYEQREIQNIIGYLIGATEPDNYVIVGGSYSDEQSTSFGDGSATNSGVATLVELARVFGKVSRAAEWRPTRTVMFCAWDAEDYGSIGSREFINDYLNILRQRSAVYINLNNLVDATVNCARNLDISSTPMLYKVIDEVSSRNEIPLQNRTIRSLPRYGDATNEFINSIGVSSATITYRGNVACPVNYSRSENENPSTLHKSQQSLGQFLAELIWNLSDDECLPLSVISYATEIVQKLKYRKGTAEASMNSPAEVNSSANWLRFQPLQSAADEFLKASEDFEKEIKQRQANSLASDRVNERLKSVERCFVDLAGRRNILLDVIERADGNINTIDQLLDKNLEEAQQDEQMIEYALDCATDTLREII